MSRSRSWGLIHNKAETLNAGLERINHVLNAPDDVPEPGNPKSPEAWKGEVEFRNVCFGYQQDSPVMRNIDLRIPAGQVVALVGPSGAGKTTFINLLCRFMMSFPAAWRWTASTCGRWVKRIFFPT